MGIKRAYVSLAYMEFMGSALADFADGTVLGLTEGKGIFESPPIPLTTITTQSTSVRGLVAQRSAGNRSPTLTGQESIAEGTLKTSLTTNGHYVEDTANAGNVGNPIAAGLLINTTGYTVRGHGTAGAREFEMVDSGPGSIHLHAPKAHPGNEGHIWRYGITTAKGIPPTVLIVRFTLTADLVITDLPSAAVVGVQHASIVPTPRAAAASSAAAAAKGASKATVSAAHHVTISHLVADPYIWTGFIYVVVP